MKLTRYYCGKPFEAIDRTVVNDDVLAAVILEVEERAAIAEELTLADMWEGSIPAIDSTT